MSKRPTYAQVTATLESNGVPYNPKTVKALCPCPDGIGMCPCGVTLKKDAEGNEINPSCGCKIKKPTY